MRTSYFGQAVEMDGQGRVLLPPVLREAAQTKGDVDVFGELGLPGSDEQHPGLDQMKNDPFTKEDIKTLEDLGI